MGVLEQILLWPDALPDANPSLFHGLGTGSVVGWIAHTEAECQGANILGCDDKSDRPFLIIFELFSRLVCVFAIRLQPDYPPKKPRSVIISREVDNGQEKETEAFRLRAQNLCNIRRDLHWPWR